jgi:hypothetical protein
MPTRAPSPICWFPRAFPALSYPFTQYSRRGRAVILSQALCDVGTGFSSPTRTTAFVSQPVGKIRRIRSLYVLEVSRGTRPQRGQRYRVGAPLGRRVFAAAPLRNSKRPISLSSCGTDRQAEIPGAKHSHEVKCFELGHAERSSPHSAISFNER